MSKPSPTSRGPKSQGLTSRGLKIPEHPLLRTGNLRRALRRERYEVKEIEAVERVLRPHHRVLELGGGIGYMSSYLCARKNVRGVTTFEANPRLIPFIEAMHAANDARQAKLVNALVTPEGGAPLPFYLRSDFLGSSLSAEDDPDSIVETVNIPQIAVAEVLAKVQPNVLICDIEGYEATLLPAADWSGLRLAVIELHPQWIGQAGVQAVFDAMQRAGLSYFPKASNAKVVTFRKGF